MVDVVFLALPHTASASVAERALAAGKKVVDLSADLRLESVATYEQWYGIVHPHPELLPVPYALVEVFRDKLRGVDVVAVPGCYPTATLLGLFPLLEAGALLRDAPVVVDAKSGITGAGRSPKPHLHFPEMYGEVAPYAVGRVHRHVPEIEAVMQRFDVAPGSLIFTPHLVPVDRGLMASITVQLDSMHPADSVRGLYEAAYGLEPLVTVLPAGQQASFKQVVRTNACHISLTPVGDRLIHITSVIDNLRKGAAGQAVQAFNLMLGLDETMALI